MSENIVTCYVTKYALLTGFVRKRQGKLISSMVGTSYVDTGSERHLLGQDAFVSEEEARIDWERRRQKKIRQTEKELTRLQSLTFEIQGE